MRLKDDPEMAEWLDRFTGDFDWDPGNRTKNKKHKVEPRDVESLFWRSTVLAGRITEPAHEEQRWLLLGVAQDGRELALVFSKRGQVEAYQLSMHAKKRTGILLGGPGP